VKRQTKESLKDLGVVAGTLIGFRIPFDRGQATRGPQPLDAIAQAKTMEK
jgi:hypothetical protein